MKRSLLLMLLSFMLSVACAQREVDKSTDWSLKERAYMGLGIGGIGLGTSQTYGRYFSIGVTPMVGYMIAKNLSGGVAFEYQYTNYSDLKVTNTVYGWYPFLRYNIQKFFIQADKDWYSLQDLSSPDKKRKVFDRFFMGVGYSSKQNEKGSFCILGSYDFQYLNTGPFNSPLSLRMFITF
jgi:hypothetical protein